MRILCMKDIDGYWVSKKSVLKVVFNYLFGNGKPKEYLTSDMYEAKKFNWFTYGFVKFMFDSYDIHVREAFIQNFKVKKGGW